QGGTGPDAGRGVHLPDGRAHHHRRPHQVPAGQRPGGVEAQGSDRTRSFLPGPRRPRQLGLLRRSGCRGGQGRRHDQGRLPEHAGSPAAGHLRRGIHRGQPDRAGGTRGVRRVPGVLRGFRRGVRGDVSPDRARSCAMTKLTLSKALNEGLRKALENDPKVLIMGEDVGKLGGVFRVTDGLQKDFGEHRVVDTPLAESGIVGTAIGLALRGYRPVCEIQFDGFVYPAFDQIVSQLAKMHYRSKGNVKLPVTIRIPCSGGIGAVEHHSESPEALFAHIPGLRVVACADAADAFTMIQQSISSDDPVIFFEPKRRYWDKAEVDTADGLAAALPMSKARVAMEGSDVTLLTYGPLVRTALEEALAAQQDGRSVEVLDLRSLSPLDMDTITASVRKTGRCVVAHEAAAYAGLGAEIAARITEQCFYNLEAPVLRVGGFATPYPPSRLEEHYLPDLDRILDGVDRTFGY